MRVLFISFFIIIVSFSFFMHAEDGSRLWLRFDNDRQNAGGIISKHKSPTIDIAVDELKNHWQGQSVEFILNKKKFIHLKDGFLIQGDNDKIVISASREQGLLYGVYHLLRLQQTKSDLSHLDLKEIPSYDVRALNHWDNLDGTIERGYAGYSLWKWDELPGTVSPRYKAYARANASIGINATVLNNVNASPDILKDDYLAKVKVLADILRPYGIKVYLSVNFSSPKILDGLENSDPMNPKVRKWWKDKVKDIYRLIPDFGGFLVKANSEGQPGPQDYGRTHADGANALADALRSHGGIVMWRAFVYNPGNEDRAKHAYQEFTPLDGKFRENVIVQVKNGPIDFQPREPFSPLFGAMKHTPLMAELQITQEYLGFSNHLVFMATQWKEFFESDTYCHGKGSTVAKTTDGTLFPHPLSAIAGVANIGQDTNWCGHHFAQANWYAFGRLAWNHGLTAGEIAEEWLCMTFTRDEDFVSPVREMMLESWSAAVNYMMPLGLHHIFAWDHHYGPEPWCDIPGARPDWLPKYYHNANEKGIGFDRTTHGSNAVSQYHSPWKEQLDDIGTCPENLLLWFHHPPWDHTMKNGRTLWDDLCYRYDTGVQQVRKFQKIWDRMERHIDRERFRHVQSRLKIHARDAVWWKDACLLYFQEYSGRPIPYDIERPVHELDDLKKIRLDLKHHN